MTLTNFNRSSYYLFILISLTTTGCSEQSTSHLAIDQAVTPEPIATELQSVVPQETAFSEYTMTPQESLVSQYPAVSQKTVRRQTKHEEANREIPQNSNESTATSTAIASTAVARHSHSLWTRMFSMYALPEIDHPRVTQELQNFLRHPKSLVALQRRAEPYLYLILEELEAKKLPGELALLPMIESAFRVNAHSQAEAAGLWQFTPATAVTFGLKQNWWYDGRRDVSASTEAATSYLKKLHKRFDGNWLLALASYNVGAGNVQKAIRKNTELALETNFWSLDLPEETKAYVPKLLAIAKIFAHAEEYNLPLQHIPNQPFFKAVNISSQLDLSTAAELAGMPLDEFFNLNPAFNHAITAPEGSYRILVKAKNAMTFKRKLAKLPKSEHVKWGEHTIKEGEDLNSIAKLHDIPVETIVEINQLKDQKLVVGSVLRLPPSKSLKTLVKV
jgi:membrane-bound lytic murein transglycosylase D